jgi:hypothetical protein
LICEASALGPWVGALALTLLLKAVAGQAVVHFKPQGVVLAFGPTGVDLNLSQLGGRKRHLLEFICAAKKASGQRQRRQQQSAD